MDRKHSGIPERNMKDRNDTGALLIVLAGVFWGSMGLFVRKLNAAGFTSFQTAFVRLSISAVVFALILLAADRSGFRIAAKDIPLFLGLGICSVMSFTVCYFKAIELMTLSAAAILLYTSPIWVMLMSALFFKEKLTAVKLRYRLCRFAALQLQLRPQNRSWRLCCMEYGMLY